MRNRKEDRIIRAAFLEDEDVVGDQVHATNSGTAELYRQYSDLRKDLQSAWEVPDHQLSNDRLRHAILGQGLKAEKSESKPEFGWLWNSVATCGIAAVLIFAFGRHRSAAPSIVDLKNSDQLAMNDSFKFHANAGPLLKMVPSPTTLTHRMEASSYRVAEVSELAKPIFHPHKLHRAVNPVESASPDPSLYAFRQGDPSELTGERVASIDPVAKPSIAPPNSSTEGTGLAADKTPTSDSVVEIDQDDDKDTGARAAREIASKNVIVGG